MIQISVQDNGIGIKQEDKSKLYKLFGFLDSSKNLNSKGIGLGLHISQIITEQFGGRIELDSEFGHGACFTFVIDLEERNDEESAIKRNLNPIKRMYPKIIVSEKLVKLEQGQSNMSAEIWHDTNREEAEQYVDPSMIKLNKAIKAKMPEEHLKSELDETQVKEQEENQQLINRRQS